MQEVIKAKITGRLVPVPVNISAIAVRREATLVGRDEQTSTVQPHSLRLSSAFTAKALWFGDFFHPPPHQTAPGRTVFKQAQY